LRDYRAVALARFHAADAVVWLDASRCICLVRATARKLKGDPTPLVNSSALDMALCQARQKRHCDCSGKHRPQLHDPSASVIQRCELVPWRGRELGGVP
jgi:hypothetical protein